MDKARNRQSLASCARPYCAGAETAAARVNQNKVSTDPMTGVVAVPSWWLALAAGFPTDDDDRIDTRQAIIRTFATHRQPARIRFSIISISTAIGASGSLAIAIIERVSR
jgi:hypothetical protein